MSRSAGEIVFLTVHGNQQVRWTRCVPVRYADFLPNNIAVKGTNTIYLVQ